MEVLQLLLTVHPGAGIQGTELSTETGQLQLSEGVLGRILATPMTPQVVITVDCGSSDEARIRLLKEHGIDAMVTDHHHIPESGPPASARACVSPARKDSRYPDRMIADKRGVSPQARCVTR